MRPKHISTLLTFLVSDSLDGRYCAKVQYSPEHDNRRTNVKAVDVDMTILLEKALGSLQFETDIPIYGVQVDTKWNKLFCNLAKAQNTQAADGLKYAYFCD